MGQHGDNLKKLYVLAKPGDCLLIANARVHIVSTKGRVRLKIEAPEDTFVELTKSFERAVDETKSR